MPEPKFEGPMGEQSANVETRDKNSEIEKLAGEIKLLKSYIAVLAEGMRKFSQTERNSTLKLAAEKILIELGVGEMIEDTFPASYRTKEK